jgi:hypothetical protein
VVSQDGGTNASNSLHSLMLPLSKSGHSLCRLICQDHGLTKDAMCMDGPRRDNEQQIG